jgi:hypothetical protein
MGIVYEAQTSGCTVAWRAEDSPQPFAPPKDRTD